MLHFLPFVRNPKRDELLQISESGCRCAGAFSNSESPKDPLKAIESLREYLSKYKMNTFHLPSKYSSVSPFPLDLEAILEDTPAVIKCCNTFTGPNPFTSILNHTTSFEPKIDYSIEGKGKA